MTQCIPFVQVMVDAFRQIVTTRSATALRYGGCAAGPIYCYASEPDCLRLGARIHSIRLRLTMRFRRGCPRLFTAFLSDVWFAQVRGVDNDETHKFNKEE